MGILVTDSFLYTTAFMNISAVFNTSIQMEFALTDQQQSLQASPTGGGSSGVSLQLPMQSRSEKKRFPIRMIQMEKIFAPKNMKENKVVFVLANVLE